MTLLGKSSTCYIQYTYNWLNSVWLVFGALMEPFGLTKNYLS